jgi:hypothetical protein
MDPLAYLAPRSRMKLERAQRRIDQAIGEELRAATSAGEVRTAKRACVSDCAAGRVANEAYIVWNSVQAKVTKS